MWDRLSRKNKYEYKESETDVGDPLAAPIRIRAFIQATKEKNEVMLSKMVSCLGENSKMRRLLESGKAFSDVAIQARYGSGIVGDHLQWHVDSYISMLTNINQLEAVDKLLLRKILKAPSSTPTEALHYLLNRKGTEMFLMCNGVNLLRMIGQFWSSRI